MDLNKIIMQESYIRSLGVNPFIIRFPCMPETVSDSKQPNWAQHDIVGRWTPIKSYAASGPRTVSIVLTFCASIDEVDGGTSYTNVLLPINQLRSLTYPNYQELAYAPDPCLLRIGRAVFMKCVLTNFDCTWKTPWDLNTEIPMIAEVSLTFEEAQLNPLDASMVILGYQTIISH